jgi:uncharacterized C2H2 Zn-finger protein
MANHIEEDHALECYFCYGRFRDFRELAEHVNEAHVSPKERQQREFTIAKRNAQEEQKSWPWSPAARRRGL